MKQVITLVVVGLLTLGCTQPNPSTSVKAYYDVAGFIAGQIALLSQQNPTVEKLARIKGQEQRGNVTDINWSRELELFNQADINKPALRNSYQIRASADSLTYQYVLKPGEQRLTVRSLRVQLDAQTRQPRRIEAVLRTDNPLYQSERRLLLEGGPAGRQWRVRQYRMEGFQQLAFFDRNEFSVQGRVK